MNNKTKVLFGTKKHLMIVLGWYGEEKSTETERDVKNQEKKIKNKIIC